MTQAHATTMIRKFLKYSVARNTGAEKDTTMVERKKTDKQIGYRGHRNLVRRIFSSFMSLMGGVRKHIECHI